MTFHRYFRTAALSAIALAGLVAPGLANDTTAELAAGGLIFLTTEDVSIASEDLFLSEKEVRVDYIFRNRGPADVTTVVAFPMPDIEGAAESTVAIPDEASDNFLDFSVTNDGKPVDAAIDRHAFAVEVDVTALLTANGIPLMPFGDATSTALAKLPRATIDDFVARGMIFAMDYDDGSGPQTDLVPIWRLKTTYWWKTTFPAGRDLHVTHRYRPSIGASAGLTFTNPAGKRFSGDAFEDAQRTYCFDSAFLKAVGKRIDDAEAGKGDYPVQTWMSYVLTTGANWAGSMDRFHLTVDKGTPETLVSFCGDGVKKTGPTTFEMTVTDFSPEKDIAITLLR